MEEKKKKNSKGIVLAFIDIKTVSKKWLHGTLSLLVNKFTSFSWLDIRLYPTLLYQSTPLASPILICNWDVLKTNQLQWRIGKNKKSLVASNREQSHSLHTTKSSALHHSYWFFKFATIFEQRTFGSMKIQEKSFLFPLLGN